MKTFIEETKDNQDWQLGNDVLYNLCETYHYHSEESHIRAKIWLIGRSYAAAIERRINNVNSINDDFYNIVVREIKKSPIDEWIQSCLVEGKTNAISVHKKLTSLFYVISGLNKRSLASKYLHFHLPSIFYIYDTRAESAIKKMKTQLKINAPNNNLPVESDSQYATFFYQCASVVKFIKDEYGIDLSPRQLDNILISRGNEKLREILKKKN